ncbi:MAG: hypothetical protein AB8I08_40415 [Sandaracinaceae bacterium]
MKCAKCGGPLTEELHGLFEDIAIQRCDACESGFYPHGTVDRLDDSLTVNAEQLAFEGSDESPLGCPSCLDSGYREQAGAAMQPLTLPAPKAAFQRCVRCSGLWMHDATLDAFRAAALAASNTENKTLNTVATQKIAEAKRAKKHE